MSQFAAPDKAMVLPAGSLALSGAPIGIAPKGALAPKGAIDLATVDVVELFLRGKRSENTQRAYRQSLKSFFGESYNIETVREFLSWPPPQIAFVLRSHKAKMLEEKQSEAAINRRLSAITSLLKFAYTLGLSQTDGRGLVEGERVQVYLDTAGISTAATKRLLQAPALRHNARDKDGNVTDEATVHSLRDQAILALFVFNGLRCNEVHLCNVEDFGGIFERRLYVLRKGRGQQKKGISLDAVTALSIEAYLRAAGHGSDKSGPLFRNVHRGQGIKGNRLTNRGIYHIVRGYQEDAGVAHLHPHKLRHTAVTHVLKLNKGNIVAAQEFSGHLDVKVLMRYFHNSQDMQGEMSQLLSNLFRDEKGHAKGRAKNF